MKIDFKTNRPNLSKLIEIIELLGFEIEEDKIPNHLQKYFK